MHMACTGRIEHGTPARMHHHLQGKVRKASPKGLHRRRGFRRCLLILSTVHLAATDEAFLSPPVHMNDRMTALSGISKSALRKVYRISQSTPSETAAAKLPSCPDDL